MELARVRRLCRIVFFLGAMVMFFGLGFYLMGHQTAGIVTLIAGLVVVMFTFSVTRFFVTYDMTHLTDRRRPAQKNEDVEEDRVPR